MATEGAIGTDNDKLLLQCFSSPSCLGGRVLAGDTGLSVVPYCFPSLHSTEIFQPLMVEDMGMAGYSGLQHSKFSRKKAGSHRREYMSMLNNHNSCHYPAL
jgi:hypothetical protein